MQTNLFFKILYAAVNAAEMWVHDVGGFAGEGWVGREGKNRTCRRQVSIGPNKTAQLRLHGGDEAPQAVVPSLGLVQLDCASLGVKVHDSFQVTSLHSGQAFSSQFSLQASPGLLYGDNAFLLCPI